MNQPKYFLRLPTEGERIHPACPTWIVEKHDTEVMAGQEFDGVAITHNVYRLGQGGPIVVCNRGSNQPVSVHATFHELENHFCEKLFQEYEAEIRTVKKDDIYAATHALEIGLEHTRSALIEHDANHGRTTAKNKSWAEQLERDIAEIEKAINHLRPL